MQQPKPKRRRRGLIGLIVDILRGAFLGDYADDLGLMGALTQVVLGYTPILGTLCAFRDYIACRQKGDHLGVILNGLSLFPVVGGVTKTAEVIERMRHGIEGYAFVRKLQEGGKGGIHSEAKRTREKGPRNPMAGLSFTTVVLAPLLMLLTLVVVLVAPSLFLLVGVIFMIPVLAVLTGHLGLHRANELRKAGKVHTGHHAAVTGLALGYLYLAVSALIAGLLALAVRAGVIHL